MCHKNLRTFSTAGCLALGLAVTTAHSDIIAASYSSSTSFDYHVLHMADIDQRRPTLGENGGYYCVPSSTLNTMIFLANHGYPDLAPGPGNWQAQSKFNEAGLHLLLLGVSMATNPSSGTDINGWFGGTWSWLNNSPYAGQFLVFQYTKGGGYWPRVHNLAKVASAGALVSFAYGRYEFAPIAEDLVILGTRNGGHAITLVRAHQSSSAGPITLQSHDPWHESPEFVLSTQSQFAKRGFTVKPLLNLNWPAMVDSLNYDPENDVVAVIDKYIAILPLFGYGYTPGGHTIVQLFPFQIGGFTPPTFTQFNFGAGAEILDVTVHPDATSMYAVVGAIGEMPKVVEVDSFTGEMTTLLEVPNANQISFGDNRLLYVLEDDRLHEVNIDIIPEKPGDPPPIQTMALPFMAAAVGFWDADDKFLVLSTEESILQAYRTDPVANVFGLPPVFEFNLEIPLAGKASMAVPPEPIVEGGAGGPPPSVWIASEASKAIYRVNLTDGSLMESVVPPGDAQPTNISVNDLGDLFISTSDGLMQMTNSDLIGWIAVEKPLFETDEPFEKFYVARSRTNYNSAIHDGPEWNNILLEDDDDPGVPACDADLTLDGSVGVPDLLALLGQWGPCNLPCPADLNFDGSIGVPDLLILLGEWGTCP